MPSLSSETDICNQALNLVASPNISVIGEDTKQGRACSTFYPPARDNLLALHDWRFATARQSLSRLDTDALNLVGGQPTELSYGFALPPDCVRARYLEPQQVSLTNDRLEVEVRALAPPHFERRGQVIFADCESAALIYTRRVENAGEFDPLFAHALVAMLAVELALHLRLNAQLVNAARNELELRLANARAASANEASNIDDRQVSWLEARA